ncbi:MAG: hypothetical protein Q8L74_14140 [Nitrospirota bacterium]|nr:hypothetical protein [Nitrospirota bacterium]MDP2383088.1 hypothetical protein [Nitrospirota bacterium]MDP3596538.1 hypothetical protein [Nitrospirota bacterium]
MPVQALTQVDPSQFFNLAPTNTTGNQRLDTKVSGVAVSTDFSGRLSVTTAEGDKITISANLQSNFRAVSYKSHAEGDGKTVDVNAKYAEYSLKQEFGVTVEGDLNEQEVKDLTSLFRKVANIFKKVLSGQDDAALAKAVKLGESFENYSSLSALDLNVDYERSVTAFAAQLTGEVVGQAGTAPEAVLPAPTTPAVTQGPLPTTDDVIQAPPADTTVPDGAVQASTTEAVPQGEAPTNDVATTPPPSETPVPSEPVASTPIASGVVGSPLTTASESAPNQLSSIVQQVLDATRNSGISPRKLDKYFSQFLSNLGKALQNGKPAESPVEGTLPTQANETPAAPAQAGPSVSLAYQSTRQTTFSLSVRT